MKSNHIANTTIKSSAKSSTSVPGGIINCMWNPLVALWTNFIGTPYFVDISSASSATKNGLNEHWNFNIRTSSLQCLTSHLARQLVKQCPGQIQQRVNIALHTVNALKHLITQEGDILIDMMVDLLQHVFVSTVIQPIRYLTEYFALEFFDCVS